MRSLAPLVMSVWLLVGAAVALWRAPRASDASKAGYNALFAGGPEQAQQAVERFRQALRWDPASASRWCDLAEALLQTSDRRQAHYCLRQAVERGPHSPPILLRAANLAWSLDEPADALRWMSRVLDLTADYDAAVFLAYDRFVVDPARALAAGIPRRRRAAQAWFRHRLALGDAPGTARAWTWLSDQSWTEDSLACQYLQSLMRSRKYTQAVEVWAKHLGPRAGDYPGFNRLFNGGFETAPTGCPLDWVLEPAPATEIVIDDGLALSGRRSARIRLLEAEDGARPRLAQAFVLEPGRYNFRASVRTGGGVPGVRFRVFDPEDARRLDEQTVSPPSSAGWQEVQMIFSVSSETRLAVLEATPHWKEPAGGKITADLWLDGVQVRPLGTLAPAGKVVAKAAQSASRSM